MLQPFELLKPMHVKKLIELKKRYLVTQTYKRAFNHAGDEQKTNILISDYDNLGQANIHLNAIKADKYAAILDLDNEKHLKKLNEMLAATSAYCLFWAIVKSAKELQEKVDKVYKDNMKKYIDNRTNWRLSRDTTLYPSVQISFGELFIILRHGSQTLRIKFEEIENI